MTRHERRRDLMRRLQTGALLRAEDLAEDYVVSARTIYRDMAHLEASGLPIEGTRGQGYRITADITLPPLALSRRELEALHLGLEVIGDSADDALRNAARSLSEKVDNSLSETLTDGGAAFGYQPSVTPAALRGYAHLPVIRAALRARQMVKVGLTDGQDFDLRPLSLDFWGRIWVLIGWDEQARRHRRVVLGEMEQVTPLPELFVDEPGKTLNDLPTEMR